MLQVGSSNDSSSSGDLDVIIRDLRKLADSAAAQDPPIKIAYEMWAWGVHVNTWEHTWETCKHVDRDNFGLCLDTFQICACAYIDPANPPNTLSNAYQNLDESLNNLTRTIPQHKIFYFQISDGSRSASASTLHKQTEQEKEEGDAGAHPLYSWSNAWRPLPWMDTLPSAVKAREERKTERREESEIEEEGFGGYLPVMDVVRAVVRTGWRGILSYEVFFEKSMNKLVEDVSRMWAKVGMECHERIMKELEVEL